MTPFGNNWLFICFICMSNLSERRLDRYRAESGPNVVIVNVFSMSNSSVFPLSYAERGKIDYNRTWERRPQ